MAILDDDVGFYWMMDLVFDTALVRITRVELVAIPEFLSTYQTSPVALWRKS